MRLELCRASRETVAPSRTRAEQRSARIRSTCEAWTTLREINERVVCPLCQRNRGWVRPYGMETAGLSLSEGSSGAAVPMVCNYCAYIRLHAVKTERDHA